MKEDDVSIRQLSMQTMAVLGSSFHPPAAGFAQGGFFMEGGDCLTQHGFYMERAIALAKKGMGFVSPNPLVGAVVVKNGRILGEGYHARYGGRWYSWHWQHSEW